MISGAGSLTQTGTGVTTLSGANTFSGRTCLPARQVDHCVTNGKALGTGAWNWTDGTELQSTATMTLTAAEILIFSGATTVAAAARQPTLTLGGGGVDVKAGVLNFGDGADDGTVVFKVVGGAAPGPFSMKVNAGTLKAGDAIFPNLVALATSVTVAAGATFDLGGFSTTAPQLLGTGKVIDSGAKAVLLDDAGTFGGVISGNLGLAVGAVTLTGANTFTGGTTIDGTLTLEAGERHRPPSSTPSSTAGPWWSMRLGRFPWPAPFPAPAW